MKILTVVYKVVYFLIICFCLIDIKSEEFEINCSLLCNLKQALGLEYWWIFMGTWYKVLV